MSDVFGAGQAVSGIAGAAATVSAASIQADAAKQATQLQQQRYDTTRGDLLPYNQAGQAATGAALGNLSSYGDTGQATVDNLNGVTAIQGSSVGYLPDAQNNSVVPGRMTQAELEATPGYQFDLSQGQKAVASSAAARGLGVSGAAMKGAASYATGLADNTYQNQFNQLQQQFADQLSKDNQNFGQGQTRFSDMQTWVQNQYNDQLNTGQFGQSAKTSSANRLAALGSLGENAAAQTGSAGAQAATAAGNYLTSGANAAGASIISGTNSLTSGLNNYLNNQQQNNLLQSLGGSSSSSGAFDGSGGGVYS